MPPRFGRDQVRAILSNTASPPPSEGLGRADLAGALDRVAVVSKRRGFVARHLRLRRRRLGATRWLASGMRHDLLAISVHDPRELDVPPIGLVQLVDPSTGRHARCA